MGTAACDAVRTIGEACAELFAAPTNVPAIADKKMVPTPQTTAAINGQRLGTDVTSSDRADGGATKGTIANFK